MPIYKCKVRGDDKLRLVRAKSQSQAAKHLVEAETVSAEEMADIMSKGVTLETYSGQADDEPETPEAPETVEQPAGKDTGTPESTPAKGGK